MEWGSVAEHGAFAPATGALPARRFRETSHQNIPLGPALHGTSSTSPSFGIASRRRSPPCQTRIATSGESSGSSKRTSIRGRAQPPRRRVADRRRRISRWWWWWVRGGGRRPGSRRVPTRGAAARTARGRALHVDARGRVQLRGHDADLARKRGERARPFVRDAARASLQSPPHSCAIFLGSSRDTSTSSS